MHTESHERVPLEDTMPDFGFPTTEAWRAAVADAESTLNISDTSNQTFAKWHEAASRKSDYLRNQTRIIPERMLDSSRPMTMDDIYAMLHVYYWWPGDSIIPSGDVDTLLADLDDARFVEAVRLLHAEFPAQCEFAEQAEPCSSKDGYACLIKDSGGDAGEFEAQDKADKVEALLILMSLEDDEESIVPSLETKLREYCLRKLAQAGLTDLEIRDSVNVIEKETERRELLRFSYQKSHPYYKYRQARMSGAEHEMFIRETLPKLIAKNPNQFSLVLGDFEDIPDDAAEWDIQKKIALTRRYLEADEEYCNQFRISYDWERYGVVPPYLYRFRPDTIFPGEI